MPKLAFGLGDLGCSGLRLQGSVWELRGLRFKGFSLGTQALAGRIQGFKVVGLGSGSSGV